jgi:hypothetical protein
VSYSLARRLRHLRSDEPISGYSMELRIHACPDGRYVLEDRNGDGSRFGVDGTDGLLGALLPALVHNHVDYFASEKAGAEAAKVKSRTAEADREPESSAPFRLVGRPSDEPGAEHMLELRIHARPDGGYVVEDNNTDARRLRVEGFAAMLAALVPVLVRDRGEQHAAPETTTASEATV